MSPQAVVVDPPITKKMFSETGAWTWVWTIVRVYVGYEWLLAGWHKVKDPAWTATGLALKGYWEKAVMIPAPPARPAITYAWFRSFLQALLDGGHHVWFAKLIAYGELVVGIALILGAFVGIAAFFGAFMNFNFMLAGSASTNPVLFLGAILLMLAWKTAGYWGLDRWLLRRLGTPWSVRHEGGPLPSPKAGGAAAG
ncbi:MAG TPA: DoxX family protein [Candidatus Eisenbacteria bacterium]|jgi:thiosulfate dehydrogenase [quinone] large subunit|nr:DoxX family protein [Candidatus Eisenbacteria bacterium]